MGGGNLKWHKLSTCQFSFKFLCVCVCLRLIQLPIAWMICFIHPYMKESPAINYSIFFFIFLAKSTKCERTTLLSTTFRQLSALVGVSDCTHKLEAWHPVAQILALLAPASVGITHTYYPDHRSLEETG